jgi:hypothetical protein
MKINNFLEANGFCPTDFDWDVNIKNDDDKNDIIIQKDFLCTNDARKEIIKLFFEHSSALFIKDCLKILDLNVEEYKGLKSVIYMFEFTVTFDSKNNGHIKMNTDWHFYDEEEIQDILKEEEIINILSSKIKEINILQLFFSDRKFQIEMIKQIQFWIKKRIEKTDFVNKIYNELPEIYLEDLKNLYKRLGKI